MTGSVTPRNEPIPIGSNDDDEDPIIIFESEILLTGSIEKIWDEINKTQPLKTSQNNQVVKENRVITFPTPNLEELGNRIRRLNLPGMPKIQNPWEAEMQYYEFNQLQMKMNPEEGEICIIPFYPAPLKVQLPHCWNFIDEMKRKKRNEH